MQKFFTDTIQNTFIKELVYSSNIPSYDSVSDGDYVFKGVVYVYRNNIVKVTKSGIIGNGAEYEKIRHYKFNEKIPKITENYISRFNYYDSETHCQLGRYLRLYRDCNGVDLMPFYNCYSGKTISDVYLGNKNEVLYVGDSKFTTYTNSYKIILIPIRFNKKYTICIDSHSTVRMKPIFYGNLGIVANSPFPEKATHYFGETEEDYSSMSFKNPIIYECNLNDIEYIDSDRGTKNKLSDSGELSEKAKMMNYEKDLYLLIQLPINNKSSILVQEGDYRYLTKHIYLFGRDNSYSDIVGDSKISRVYSEENIDDLTNKEINNILLSSIQLQLLSTGESYAYSDKLISYLLDNVVTSADCFGGDVERIQNILTKEDPLLKIGKPGIWNRQVRSYLFRNYVSSNIVKKSDNAVKYTRDRAIVDINGFVDRDIEDYLNKVGE